MYYKVFKKVRRLSLRKRNIEFIGMPYGNIFSLFCTTVPLSDNHQQLFRCFRFCLRVRVRVKDNFVIGHKAVNFMYGWMWWKKSEMKTTKKKHCCSAIVTLFHSIKLMLVLNISLLAFFFNLIWSWAFIFFTAN